MLLFIYVNKQRIDKFEGLKIDSPLINQGRASHRFVLYTNIIFWNRSVTEKSWKRAINKSCDLAQECAWSMNQLVLKDTSTVKIGIWRAKIQRILFLFRLYEIMVNYVRKDGSKRRKHWWKRMFAIWGIQKQEKCLGYIKMFTDAFIVHIHIKFTEMDILY